MVIYQSIPGLTILPPRAKPPGNSFDGRIPHPPPPPEQKRSSKPTQSFKQIKQKTPEILHFHFFIVLQHCDCDVIFKWKWGWKPTKWRCPSCPNSWLWNGISRESFGTLRSVMARFFCIFQALSFERNFFSDWRCPLKDKLGLQLSPVYIIGKFTLINCKTLYIFVRIYSLIRLDAIRRLGSIRIK